MARFHTLPVAAVDQLTDDSVALTFAVPPELREEYRYAPGQHLALRRTVDGTEIRRTYSICSCGARPRCRGGRRPPDAAGRGAARRGRVLLDVRPQGDRCRRRVGGDDTSRPFHTRTGARAVRGGGRRQWHHTRAVDRHDTAGPRARGAVLPHTQRPYVRLDDVPRGGRRSEGPLPGAVPAGDGALPRGAAGRSALRSARPRAAHRAAAGRCCRSTRCRAGFCAGRSGWCRGRSGRCATSGSHGAVSTRRSSMWTTGPH